MKIKIGKRMTGDNEPCYIIAEAGVNHNGDFKTAKKMIDVAIEAKADAIKFQAFRAENLVTRNVKKAAYQRNAAEKTQFEMLKKLELDFTEFKKLKKYCEKKGIEFLSTPYDINSVSELEKLNINAFKLASADIINKPLISAIAKTKKPTLVSTGVATDKEIGNAIRLVKSFGNKKIILLHCISSYPVSASQANMKRILALKKFNLQVGYSDHSVGIAMPLLAKCLGATVIEKHFTLNKKATGPDHSSSADLSELKTIVAAVREIESALGQNSRKANLSEKQNKFFLRTSIHASKKIKKGEVVSEKNIKLVRPADGISPWFFNKVLGKRLKKTVNSDTPLHWKNLA